MPAKVLRSTGTATLTFGLVSAPAKLYAATEGKSEVSFNMLHGACKGRVRQQYVCGNEACESCGKPVDRDGIVKGFEHAKGEYVAFSADEIKALQEEASESIDVCEFVPAGSVDPIYFDKSYYLAPDKGGAKAFSLIVEAMRRSGRHAIGKYAARGKMHVVLLRPVVFNGDGGMVVHQLRYADEVREVVPVAEVPVDAGMIDLALKLVEQRSSATFDPSKYRDEVKDRILDAIRRKVEGAEAAPPPAPRAEIVDIMSALRASLGRAA